MSEVKAHAQYSPSASERWVNCPASIPLSIGCPPSPESEAARLGTNAHTLLEYRLKGKPETRSLRASLGFTPDMDKAVDSAVKAVTKFYQATNKKNTQVLVEEKADLRPIFKADFWGTADVQIVEEWGVLHVIDYKHGIGKAVDAEENFQGLAYTLAIAHKYHYNFDHYKFSIIQPRAPHRKGAIRSWAFGLNRLLRQKDIFARAIEESQKQNPEIRAGSWCFFCPAISKCPRKQEERVSRVKKLFSKE